MFFNSIDFAIFLPVVFFLYWFVTNKNLKLQNALLILSSYVFYSWWDWRFLSLIIFSSGVDYLISLKILTTNEKRKRKLLLALSIIINLGFLGFFKYFNFFAENFAEAFTLFGKHMDPARLEIILPVGISFYTFQTLSYSIDVYRRKLEPTSDILAFFAFVSFFPQLVAGPIERATNLLPQLQRKREFAYGNAVKGMHQILWGLFKKIVIADNAAVYVNDIFANYGDYAGSTLFIGGVFFAFQIYCDFSGYSDIAIGTSRLFGINLKQNFAFPYFSRNIAEFWRRWHISLSTWFRDYLYIPLGGSQGNTFTKIRNTFIIFLVSGFWHGSKWTFIAWGFINALYFLPLLLTETNRRNLDTVAHGKWLPSIRELMQMASTFLIVTIAWIFFRADSMALSIAYLEKMFSASLFDSPLKDIWTINTGFHIVYLSVMLLGFVCVEWIQREKQHGLEMSNSIPRRWRWSIYYILIICCFLMNGVQQDFIYFQF